MSAIAESVRMLVFLTALGGLIMLGAFAGCNSQPVESDAPPAERGLDIEAPGVDVEINKDGERRVDVEAPGVDVDVEGERNP